MSANLEQQLLAALEANITASTDSARMSEDIVNAALASARTTLESVAVARSNHSQYMALYVANNNYITALTGTVDMLEDTTMNASM